MSDKTSCIQHPANSSFVKLEQAYLDICDSDHCAAMILSVMERWHNTKLTNQPQAELANAMAANEGLPPEQDAGLWVYMSYDQFGDALMGLFGEKKIATAVHLLLDKGYLQTRTNPKHRYDRIPQYLFQPEIVQDALSHNSGSRERIIASMSARKDGDSRRKKAAAIPQSTSESTTESANAEKQQPQDEAERPNAFKIYEQNVGLLTPLIADAIKDMLKTYPPEWVEDAIKETALSGGKSAKYAEKVLQRWEREGKSTGRPTVTVLKSPPTQQPVNIVSAPQADKATQLAAKLTLGWDVADVMAAVKANSPKKGLLP